MENEVNNINKEAIVTEIIIPMKSLEYCSLEDFLILLYNIVGQFDRVFSKYDVKEFRKALKKPKISTFRGLL